MDEELLLAAPVSGDCIALKFDTTASGSFAAYASVFSIADAQHDIVAKGAYTDALRTVHSVPLLLGHDPASLLGKADGLHEDSFGLRFTGKLTLGTQPADDVYRHMMAGVMDGVSVGVRFRPSDVSRDGGIRTIKRAAPFEVSLTPWPANSLARVDLSSLKSWLARRTDVEDDSDAKEFLAVLRQHVNGLLPVAASSDAAVIEQLRKSGIRRLR